MARVYTPLIHAQMIEVHAYWHRSYKSLIYSFVSALLYAPLFGLAVTIWPN